MDQLSGLNISEGILSEYTGQASDIIIPDNVKVIASAVFKDYHALHSIMLPAGLKEIESRGFEGCTGLRTVMFPASLSVIGKYAFAGCSSLVFFRLPAALTEIGSYAFKDCTSLSSVEMPEYVREIGVGAFTGCSSLKSIRIPGRQTSIKSAFGTHPFVGCSDLKIYTPAGSEAEKFALDNGIPVVNTKTLEGEGLKKAGNSAVSSDTSYEASSKEAENVPKTISVSSRPEEKTTFTFAMPEPAAPAPSPSPARTPAPAPSPARAPASAPPVPAPASAEPAPAEKNTADTDDHGSGKKQQIYAEAVSLYELGTESDMQKAIEMMRSISSYSDARHRAREFAKGLKKKQKAERKEETEKAKLERRKASAQKKAEKQEEAAKQEKAAKPKRSFMRRAAVILLVLVLAAGAGAAGMYYARTHTGSSGDSNKPDYTLTLEDYINSNDIAKEQLIQSVEDTDVSISVSKNTLIYTYDLSSSNSVTPELAQSEELKESLGETLDSSDEKFRELCTGLEKDTGISGVSVEVIFRYGDEELLTRTYTSEGRQ